MVKPLARYRRLLLSVGRMRLYLVLKGAATWMHDGGRQANGAQIVCVIFLYTGFNSVLFPGTFGDDEDGDDQGAQGCTLPTRLEF